MHHFRDPPSLKRNPLWYSSFKTRVRKTIPEVFRSSTRSLLFPSLNERRVTRWQIGRGISFHLGWEAAPWREGRKAFRKNAIFRPAKKTKNVIRTRNWIPKWNSIWQRGNHLSWRPLPITYSAYPAHETWVARTSGGMRLAAHGLHPTALWNRFNGEDSLWKPWYPMDSDTTLSRLMGRE